MPGVVDTVIGGAARIVDMFHTSDEEKAEAHRLLRGVEIEARAQEIELEKAHIDLLKSQQTDQSAQNLASVQRGFSWRDGLGWTMVLAVLMKFVLAPIDVLGIDASAIGTAELWPVLVGMLGLGGMRSAEKITVFKNGRH